MLKLTATAGSLEADTALVPIPRIEKLYMLKLAFEKVTFGTARSSSDPPSIWRDSRASDERAVTAIGTSCTDCSRFCAVTTMSSTTAGAVCD